MKNVASKIVTDDEILALHTEGLSNRAIAHRLGRNAVTINDRVKKLGLRPNASRNGRPPRFERVGTAVKSKIENPREQLMEFSKAFVGSGGVITSLDDLEFHASCSTKTIRKAPEGIEKAGLIKCSITPVGVFCKLNNEKIQQEIDAGKAALQQLGKEADAAFEIPTQEVS